MLPSDFYNRHHHTNTNQASSNLLDFLEPHQNENSHAGSQLDKNSIAPNESTPDSEVDLINLVAYNHSSSQEKVPVKMKGLVDLIDNLYVTPHENIVTKKENIADIQLKMLEEFVMTSKTPSKSVSQEHTAEFQSFFDKYEFDKKPTTSIHKLGKTDLHLFEPKSHPDGKCYSSCVNNVDVKSNISRESLPRYTEQVRGTENTVNELQFPYNFNGKTIQNTDLQKQCATSELISHNNTETKQVYSGVEEFLNIPNGFDETAKTANGSLTSKEDNANIFDEIVTRNKITHRTPPVASNFIPNSVTDAEPIKVPMTGIDKHNKTCYKTRLDQKALTQELVTKYDIKYLEAVKKIDKTFKKSILKSDEEKLKLTRGPDLFEKSMVLPLILHRLDQKNRALEDKSNVKMRLILEAGSSVNTQANVNSSVLASIKHGILKPPEVLLADCNKERLKAFETGKLLSKLVRKEDHFVPKYE